MVGAWPYNDYLIITILILSITIILIVVTITIVVFQSCSHLPLDASWISWFSSSSEKPLLRARSRDGDASIVVLD